MQPDDYLAHTTARDPHEKFACKFPDADGHLISNEDPQFQGKVVLAIVTGTWCPNCHDEAQYLVQLDKKYRDRDCASWRWISRNLNSRVRWRANVQQEFEGKIQTLVAEKASTRTKTASVVTASDAPERMAKAD